MLLLLRRTTTITAALLLLLLLLPSATTAAAAFCPESRQQQQHAAAAASASATKTVLSALPYPPFGGGPGPYPHPFGPPPPGPYHHAHAYGPPPPPPPPYRRRRPRYGGPGPTAGPSRTRLYYDDLADEVIANDGILELKQLMDKYGIANMAELEAVLRGDDDSGRTAAAVDDSCIDDDDDDVVSSPSSSFEQRRPQPQQQPHHRHNNNHHNSNNNNIFADDLMKLTHDIRQELQPQLVLIKTELEKRFSAKMKQAMDAFSSMRVYEHKLHQLQMDTNSPIDTQTFLESMADFEQALAQYTASDEYDPATTAALEVLPPTLSGLIQEINVLRDLVADAMDDEVVDHGYEEDPVVVEKYQQKRAPQQEPPMSSAPVDPEMFFARFDGGNADTTAQQVQELFETISEQQQAEQDQDQNQPYVDAEILSPEEMHELEELLYQKAHPSSNINGKRRPRDEEEGAIHEVDGYDDDPTYDATRGKDLFDHDDNGKKDLFDDYDNDGFSRDRSNNKRNNGNNRKKKDGSGARWSSENYNDVDFSSPFEKEFVRVGAPDSFNPPPYSGSSDQQRHNSNGGSGSWGSSNSGHWASNNQGYAKSPYQSGSPFRNQAQENGHQVYGSNSGDHVFIESDKWRKGSGSGFSTSSSSSFGGGNHFQMDTMDKSVGAPAGCSNRWNPDWCVSDRRP